MTTRLEREQDWALGRELERKDAKIERLTLALRSAGCPSGGYTGQPADEEPTVGACLKAGVCGCDLGAALATPSPPEHPETQR